VDNNAAAEEDQQSSVSFVAQSSIASPRRQERPLTTAPLAATLSDENAVNRQISIGAILHGTNTSVPF
jgi:hypothetical protein